MWNEISCTKLQLPPEPQNRGLSPSRSPFSLSSVLNWICWTPPRTKFLGTPLLCNTVAQPSDHKVSYPHDHSVSLHSPEILKSYRQTTLKGKLGELHITKSYCNALLYRHNTFRLHNENHCHWVPRITQYHCNALQWRHETFWLLNEVGVSECQLSYN